MSPRCPTCASGRRAKVLRGAFGEQPVLQCKQCGTFGYAPTFEDPPASPIDADDADGVSA